ncbi:hypothetical protein C8R43DRAFT_942043 [Mycena crocata]|nr:hypothetical protein C8R43DRAFT_942043 [Mycena crocata]
MRLDDPEYAPVYYKVMVLDQSGTAEKCVKPPAIGREERREERPRTWGKPNNVSTQNSAPDNTSPATFPNSIALGKTTEPFRGCFGCLEEGHHISECEKVQQLIEKNVMAYNPETRRLTMKNGRDIRRLAGESLVKAAERIASLTSAPRVMLGFLDAHEDRRHFVQNFYQGENRRVIIEEVGSEESQDPESSSDNEDSEKEVELQKTVRRLEKVYLTSSKTTDSDGPWVQPVERTETSTRKARREVFDGVYPPNREKVTRKVRDLAEDEKEKETRLSPASGKPTGKSDMTHPVNRETVGKSSNGSSNSHSNPANTLPELTPVEARKVRFEDIPEVEMKDVRSHKKNSGKDNGDKMKDQVISLDDGSLARINGRQSEISATVNKQQVLDRILDAQIPMSIREIMVTSKELRSDIQDLIKVKNVKAILLGNSENHPIMTTLDWPRSEGILIKVEMETNGKVVCAIIDTGSQLDVVRADVAALNIRRSVDMSQVTHMNDANGGKGQLQGWIREVEFNCGGAVTVADLWVSQKAPFELLLGRPWQRGNLVSIDEREEGTYLIFKDRNTRRPRFELLAVPYDRTFGELQLSQYQSFSIFTDNTPFSHVHSEKGTMKGLEHHEDELRRVKSRLRSLPIRINGNGHDSVRRYHDSLRNYHKRLAFSEALKLQKGILNNIMTACRRFWQKWNVHTCLIESGSARKKAYKSITVLRNNPKLPSFIMALTVPSWDDHAQPISADLGPLPYEDIQYFSHTQTHQPPRAISGFTDDPEETVRNSVARQWRNYTQHVPLNVNPTFAASPQSEYGGRVTLPSGQVLHRSVGLNVLRVFRNPDTGVPFSIACHEFTYHLESEQDSVKPWALEVILPSKSRLRQAMFDMTPLDPPGEGETGFPNHTTNYTPPMIPIDHRLAPERVSLSASRMFSSANPDQYFPGPEANHAPIHSATEATRLDELTAIPERHQLRGLSSDALAQLSADIQSRATPSLSFGEIDAHAGYFTYSVPDFSETDSVPELVDAPYGPLVFHFDDGSSYQPGLIPEVCGTCMGPKHDEGQCSYEGQPQRPGAEQARATYNAMFPNNQIPTPSVVRISEESSFEQQAAERARQDTDEIRDTLELVLVPLMDDMMGLPTSGSEVYGRLASQARNVQTAFGEFAQKMEEKHEREERIVAEMSNEVLADQNDWQQISRSTRVSRVATPALSGRRGPLITRDEWSSSSASSPSTTDSSFDSESYSPLASSIVHKTERQGSLTPITEWALTQSEPTEPPASSTVPSPLIPISDDHDDDSERSIPLADLIPLSRVAGPLFFASGSPSYQQLPEGSDYYNTEKYARQRRELDGWLKFGNDHLADHSRQEDEVASYPLQHVLNTLHGELRDFIDYPTMAGANFRGLQTLSPLSMGDPHAHSVTADLISEFPNPTQSPTSLDFSLPSNESHDRTVASSLPSDLTSNLPGETAVGGSKRKEQTDGSNDVSDERPQKRLRKFDGELLRRQVTERNALKAIQILEPKNVRLFAGSRLGLLEGGRIIESIVWHRYGVSTEFFPDGFVTHPFLDDLEAAKLHTLWDLLRFQGRHQLAELLFDILTIRLRDEYVLNAHGLELAYPETQNQYHELLGVPAYQHSYGPAEFDIDSDSEASGFGGMDLGYPDDEYEGSFFVDGYPDDVYDRDLRDDSISVEDTSEIMFAQPPYYDDISYDGSSLSEDASDYMDAASDENSNNLAIFHADASSQGPGIYLRDIDDGGSGNGHDDDSHIAASQPRFDWSVPVNSVRRALTNPSQISTT